MAAGDGDGPLIRPPAGALEAALKGLEPGEVWAVRPRRVGDNPNLWSPGIKWGVSPGSVTHTTELFGPVLGVIRVGSLEEALEVHNDCAYGLSSSIYTRDVNAALGAMRLRIVAALRST